MIRRASALLILVTSVTSGLLRTGAGKKEEDPQSIPVPAAAPSAAPVAADTSTAAASSAAPAPSAVAPTTDTAATPQPPTGTKTAAGGQNIDTCCAALSTMSLLSGKSAESKAKAGAVSKACYGISKLVKEGKTTRSAGLLQVKSALGDVTPPPECN